jgi:hypothetical protein
MQKDQKPVVLKIDDGPAISTTASRCLKRAMEHLDALPIGELKTSKTLASLLGYTVHHFMDASRSSLADQYKCRRKNGSVLWGNQKTIEYIKANNVEV